MELIFSGGSLSTRFLPGSTTSSMTAPGGSPKPSTASTLYMVTPSLRPLTMQKGLPALSARDEARLLASSMVGRSSLVMPLI